MPKSNANRFQHAMKWKPWVETECRRIAANLVVSNHGHHWRVYSQNREHVIQWWPSSGKLFHSEFGKQAPVKAVEDFVGVLYAFLGEENNGIPPSQVAREESKGWSLPTVRAQTDEELCAVLCLQ